MQVPSSLTSEPALLARFDRVGRTMAFRAHSSAELQAWQCDLRSKLRTITGMDTMEVCPLEVEEGTAEQMDGYTRHWISIQTEPGIRMSVYVLIPDGLAPSLRRPAVIAPHGHASAGKYAVAGRDDIPEVAETIAQHNYAYGVQLVQAGFVVFCPDARGFGERREQSMMDDEPLGGSCQVLNHMALPLGQTVTGMWTWDLLRLLDYIVTRDDCDAERIGVAGLSGGGLQALWLAALDERIRCAVVSGYFYGFKDSLLHLNRNCSCNYVPGLWQLVDVGDIGALIAPRPLFIETGSLDGLNGERGLANVTEQVAITGKAYKVLQVEDQLVHTIFEGEHRWHGVDAVPWLVHHLGLNEALHSQGAPK